MLKAIIWDNDGVLTDTASLFRDANKNALQAKGILMNEALFTKISEKQGKSILEYYAKQNLLSPQELNELVSTRRTIYTQMLKNGAIFNRDAFDLIAQLKKKKIKNFMVTGSVKAELLLEYANKDDLLAMFDGIITADDYVHPKPDAESILCALNRWNISAKSAVVIDDLPRGLIAAHRAGVRAIRYNPFKVKSKYRNFAKFYRTLMEIING